MKGKFKGKILNLRNIIVSLIIVVMAAVSGISIVQYNSKKLTTNTGAANQSNYPITGADLVRNAVKYLGADMDCSGLINQAISDAGGTVKAGSSSDWNSARFVYSFGSTDYEAHDLKKTNNNNGKKTKWFYKVDHPKTLKIGTVISGHGDYSTSGHVFIYLGEADKYETLQTNLKKYNINLPAYDKDNNKFDIRDIDSVNGGPYWYIEGNATTNRVKIRNFSWDVNNENDVKNMKYIKVWKITEPPSGSYSIRINKKSKNFNGPLLAGVQFKIEHVDSKGNLVDSTTVTSSDTKYVKVTGLKNMNSSGDIEINSAENNDYYRISETSTIKGYQNNNKEPIYLRVYKDYGKNGEYVISAIGVGDSIEAANNNNNLARDDNDSTIVNVNDHLRIDFHGMGGENAFGVINFVFADDEDEPNPPKDYSYSVILKKSELINGSHKLVTSTENNNVSFTTDSTYIQPYNSTATEDTLYQNYKTDLNQGNNGEYFRNIKNNNFQSNDFLAKDVRIGSTNYKFASTMHTNAIAGKKLNIDNITYENNKFIITDTYTFNENKISGYKKDPTEYTLEIKKSYDSNQKVIINNETYWGRIESITIKYTDEKGEIHKDTKTFDNGKIIETNLISDISVNNVSVCIQCNEEGAYTITIFEDNDKIEGSYEIYYGKKSQYENVYQTTNGWKNEISKDENIAGASFTVKKYFNDNMDENYPDEEKIVESEAGVWESFTVTTNSTKTDRFRIIENSPPDTFGEGFVSQIWFDVYKTETKDKIEVEHIEVSFRDKYGNLVCRNEDGNYGQKNYYDSRYFYAGSCVNGWFQVEKPSGIFKAIFAFQNPKSYNLYVTKEDKNGNIIEGSEENARFSVKMYKTKQENNDTITLADEHSIRTTIINNNQERLKAVVENVEAVSGIIDFGKWMVDSDMINKTFYYLITEDNAPTGYNSIGSLIVGIHFDSNGDSSIESLYHVTRNSENTYKIKNLGSKGEQSIVTGLGENINATAANDSKVKNKIDLSIQQPTKIDSTYSIQLKKFDSSSNKTLAGVKFETSEVKINNENIRNKNTDLRDTFETTSNTSITNLINEIYTNTDNKEAIGKEYEVINKDVTTDTYTIKEKSTITGYELNEISTTINVHKKFNNENLENDYVGVVFNNNENEIKVDDGYFVSSLDSTASTNDDRKVENLDNYINSLKNENIVIVYYTNGKISVQYYNKLEGTYSVVLNKYVNNRVSNDSSINFKISLYKKKNSNNEFSETDEIKEVQTKKGTVKLSDLTTAQSITDSLQEIFITENEIGKTYYYVLEETKTRNDLIKLDYKIVIPFKFVKDEYNEYVITNAEEKGFGLKNNEKIEIRNGGLINDTEDVCYIIGESDMSLMQIMVNNFEKEGNYNLKLLKIKAKDGFTADLLSQLKNANSINDLNALAKSGARFGVKRTTRGGSSVSENTQDITSEEGKVKDVYDGQLDINEDDMNFNPEYNEKNGGDAKLDYGTSRFTIDEWSATGTGMKVNKAISNLEIETKLSRGTDKYSLTDVKVYDKTQNKEITADEAFTKYGLFVKIMNSEDGTPILITAVADDVITGEFSFNLKKVNSKTGKELTAEECNGMKFNFGLYQGGDSYDNPGTKVTELTKKDGTTVNISNLTTLQEINDAMSNIEITEEMDKQTTYRLIIEETEAPADFVKFNHKIGCTLISNQNENEEYKMIYTDFKVYDGKYWQYYSQYEEVDFNQTDSINTLTLTLKNVPKTGSYNLDVEKVDLSGNDIKDETTRFSVKAYSSLYNRTDGKFALEASSRIEIKDKKENILTATDGKSTELRDIQINKEDIGKTYYFVIEETDAPYQFTKLNYKIVVPITFSENENEYKASKCEAYAFVKDESISDSSYEDKAVYIKKSLSEVATSQKDTVTVEQNQDSTTINVKVPNKSEYTLKIKKVGAGTNEPLSNVQFNLIGAKINGTALKNSNNQEITTSNSETVTTDSEGLANVCENTSVPNPVSITSIESDEYYFTEETEPDGHRKLPDNVAIELLVKKGSDGKVNELNILVVNKNDKSIIQKGRYALTYIINEYGDTVTISAVKTADNEIILTVSDPEDTRNGNYNLYLLKKDNNNTVLSGVNFELIGAKVSNEEIISVDSPKDAKAIVTGTDKVSVYTNAKDENGNDVIQINNTNLEEDDEFILREKDLGSNNGYTQLPSNYKIKVKVQKSEGNNKYFVSGTTLELYNENNQIVSPKENTEDEYEINGVTYKISLEKSGSNITVIVENPKVEGEYKLNVIKKDVNNQGSVSGFDSFGTNSVAGAKFNITLYKNVILNYKDFNIGSSFGNKVRFGSYTTKGTTEDLNHDNFKRTEITYSEIEQNRIDIWRIAETDPPTGFESMKNDLVLGIEKTYDEKTKQFYIDTIHIYQLNGDGTITWDPQSYEEINKADGSVMYTYVSSDNDTWQIMLNKDRTQIAVSADNIPNGEYKLNVMKKITDDNSSGDTADSAKSGASFNIQLYKDIDLNSSNFKFGSDNNPNNFENFTQDENEYISYETKGNAEDLTNDKFKRTGITTDSVGNKYDIWKINEWSAPDGLDTYSGQLVLGVKKKYNSDNHTFSIESITMYKVDGNGIKSSNNVWEAQTVHDVNNSNADSTEMNTYTTYSYFDTDSTGNNVRRWDFVIKNNSQIYVTLHNNPTEYGYYNVNLVKHDEYGNNISGVKFMAIREVNGGAPEAIYTEQNPLVTSYTNVNIGGTVNIDGTKVNTDDVYTLKELDLDENSEYTKIPGNIKLTVKKATRKNSNYSKTHYVERIQLRLVSDDGQKVITPTENLFNKQVIETTINGEKANITAELIDNTITITVVNPDKTGLYSLDLTKVEKGTNTPLDGAEFEVKYYNSMSTQNETESVNVLNSDGTISTIKTSEIKTVADFKKLQNIIVNESTAPFSYWIIKETKAPAGHDLLKYKIEIRIFKENTSDGYKVSSDRARALYEDGTNKLLEDLTEDEPKTTITEDKESSTYKLNINVENAITPKGTYSLNLNKVDKATKSNLTGAEFEVSLKSGRTKIPSVTIVNDDNTETTIDLSTIKSVDDFNKLKNIKITSEGSFVWQIKETKAPEGFKKLDYYISIIFNSTNVNNNYVIKKVSADAIYESDGSYRSTPIEALDKNEPQTTITETTTGTYQANITIENNSYGGSYKLSLMKKNEADASHDIYSNGDDSRSALAGATFDVKLYKNIQKNNSNFEFNSQYNEENKGPYTTVGADDLSESNEIVRDGLTSSGFDSNYYDIWKIEETKAPGGYIKMTEPLVLGVEKNYDSTTNTFTINDIYVYQKNSNGLKSDGGKWVVLPVTNKEGNTAHGEDGNAMVKNSTYIFEQDGNKWSLVLSADKTRMIVTAFDKKISKFNFKLIKKEQDAEKTLPGALFEITIKDENGKPLKTASGTEINKYQQTTSAAVGGDSNGTIKINDILIDGENKKYTVEITELLAPAGYEKIMDKISFQVTSKLADDGSYMLIPGDYAVANTKQCEVDESGNVIVTVEDKKTEKVEFAIYKKWENVNDTELPESITVELYQVPENKLDDWNKVKGDANARQEYLYRGAYGAGGQVTLTKADALNGNNLLWYHKWTGLSKENTDTKVKNIYYVIETDGPEGFITTYEDYVDPDTSSTTITNTKVKGSYKLSLMKKNEADASHDIYSNGDDSRSALAGATFDVKLYKNIQKNNSNFEFNSQYNEENKGPYTTVGADDLSESNEIVRDGLTSSGFDSNYYDIWKIEETSAPGGYIKMTSPLVLGVEKNYDSTTNTFTINDIYVYQKNSNGLKSDGGKWVVLPVTNKEGNTAHGEDGNAIVKNSTYIFEQDGNTWSLVLSADKTKMIVTAFDKKISKFNFKLIKKEQGSDKTLSSALFETTIKDENGNPLKTSSGTEINKYQQKTNGNGTIGFDDILIDGANKKYTVEITEVVAPTGYERIMDTISFQVTSKLADDGSYMLTPGDYTVANTKQCEVDESGNVIVTVEDKKTEKVEFAIYKKWENVNDTELPESITVELYQVPENKLDAWNIVKDSAKARQEYLYRGAHGTGGRVTLTKDNAVNGNNLMWYYKWTDLSKENTDTKVKNIYYVIETDGPEGFITTYEPNNYKSPDVNTVTITNTIDNGSYKLSLMKKDEADASHDIYSNGDDSRSALAGATFDVKLYKNIQKNNSNFEFNNQYNEENKGPYTTVGADDLSEQNEIVRDGLTSNGYSTGDYYDIWKIEETSAPDGYVKMTSPLVLGVEKKYDSKTRTFTINDIYVYQKNSNGLKSDGGKWVVLPVTNKEGNTAHGEDGNVMVKNSTYIFEQDGNTWSLVLSSDKTKMIVTAFDKKEEEGQYDLNIQKRSTSGEILNGVEFSLMSAKVNNETVKNSKGETATNEKFVTSSVGIANVPSLTSVPNPIKITDVDNADVYVFRETNLPESIKNKYAKLPDYVSIELTVNKGREEVDGKTQLVAKSVSVKVIDNRTKKEYVGNRNNMVEYSFESNGKTYTAQIKASISNNTVTLTVENPDIPPEGEYKLSLVKAGNDERLGGVKFNLISARVNNGTIQNGSSSVSEDNPIVITTNAQKPVGIWPTDGSSMKILSATSDEYILKEADLGNNNKYVKLPDNKLIKLVILKEETNNEFKVSSINMYVGNDTDGWEPATYIFNEAHNMIIEARSTVTDSKGNEFTISFARSGDNLTLTVEDPKEETTKYTVSKKWDDANKTDSRPDYVEFRLFGFAKNDAEAQKIYNDLNNSLQSKAYKMISSKIKDKSILQYKCTGDINVRADDGWQEATWYNLSKDYNYFAWEISDIDGYDITNAEVSNNNTKLTITNKKDTTKYTIQKVWAEGTEMPKNLEVRLYSFDKDSQDYNELIGYVNSKDYDKINEKVKTLTPSGQSVYLWADTNWSHTWGGLDKDRSYFAWEVDKDALVKYNITNAEISEEGTKMTITNTKPVSKFNLTLVKYEQGSDKTLSGALFEITIKDENGNPLKTVNGTEINKYQQTTSATYGRISLDDIIIDGADKKYTVEITEVLAPAGYERIMDTISFQVTSKLADDGSYMLTPGDYTVANTKQCEVDESGNVIVNVEDKKTDKTEFAIYKKWENVKDTELPDSITVELYQVPENKLDAWNIIKEEADARQEYLYRGAYGSGGRVTLTKDNAINSSTWYYKWTDLSKENNDTKVKNIYYVIETDGPEGFITTYEPNNYKSPDVNTVTITNTKETTQYTIQKVWDKNVQTSSMPRTLQVSLFAFNKNDENDTKLYNELIGYVNNKQYNEINNKIAELTDKKVGSSIGLSVGNQWSFTWSELSKDNNYFAWETDANALSKFNITNAVISDEGTKMTITNTQPEGSFKLKLIKKLTNTNITLANAKFTLSIKDEAGNELIPNTSYEYKTDANGEIVVDKLAITGPNKEYTVTIKETKAPAGYAKLTDEVSFKVKSHAKADGSGFELIANDLTPIKNAKDAKVTEDGIEVTIYNDLTSPHKGVKDIKNQDSGYYDNVTGKVYTSKEEVASTLHDWVIQTTIPEGITAYTTYEISDEINEKLVFAGLDTVKVKYVNGADLTKDKDYKVTYDEASRMLKVTFIDESFKGGYNLEVGKDVEIRFNTTFALDNDGNIIAINEEVPNQAKLTYGNDSNNKQTKLTEIPEVHTGGVGIYKYDKKTNKALEGAHFKIATSKENALAGIFVKDGNGQDIEKITNSNGLAEFAGLEFGEDALNKAEYETYDSITGAKVYKYDTSKLSTTYYLVETESPKGYLKLEEPVEVVVKVGSYDMKDITSLVQVGNEEGIYDLSLRKFITAVKDTAKGTEEEVTSRIPQVDLTKLASGESTTATYTHPKDPVLVHTTDIVTYTIRIYNEGPQDAYASIVKDDIPDGLQFVQYTEGDGSLNAEYRWKLVDENDNEVTDVSKAKYIVTDYLSKEQDKTPGANLLKAYKPGTMSELDYRDVKVQFKVTEPTTSDRILINYAQISKETDSSGRVVRDRDSTPNVWVEGEDDQDIEKVRVQYFDLSLRKWVTQAIVTENGKTVVTQTGHKAEDNPEEVVKVDLKKSKINNVVVKFRYSIRITNEGEIAGEATEIRDDIPQGLKFVAEDNPDWREENGQIVTNKLEHTTLQPGESAEVEILLTWINSVNNMGVMTNVAEINKDHNDYGAPDIDSTPGNNVPGEDDIDDAPVMLTVKTGSEYILYASIALSAIAVIAVGGKVIKKKVMRNI
ncbi:MAG TPA: SpaA isopeptide-forming pilin-related protein [Clostridiaceae bacterium]|nr:SpaA isopeptide-forming pilin-related protein [Clostridiaceae bacterium]